MKKLYLLAISLLAYFSIVRAQPYYFSHFQVENGLSNNTVLCSLQDNTGFLWFGTKDGLNRFDGYTFKTFRNQPGTPGSIGNNNILCLYKDATGILWVGTEHGIFSYNPLLENFTYLQASAGNEIRDIKTDAGGNLWFIGGLTLFRYNRYTHQLQTFNTFEATAMVFVGSELWVATASGFLERYNAVSNTFKEYHMFAHSQAPTSTWIQNLFNTGRGKLFVGTSNQGLKVFDLNTYTYEDVLTYNADHTEIYVRNVIERNSDNYWIGTESGVYDSNLTTRQAILLHKQYNNPYSLSDNAIYTFCRDREGGIWIGTYFGGLNYYTNEYTLFEKFFPKMGENSLSGNDVREICEDGYGNLWIGTEDGGLNRLDKRTGKFYNYPPLGSPENVSASNIHGLLVNGKQLLIGTFEHGLDVMDIATKKVIKHCTVSNEPALRSNFFFCLYKTPGGQILAGTTRGLYEYHPENHQLSLVTDVPENQFYTSIYEDSNHTIWIGTYRSGLYYYNRITGQHGLYKYEPQNNISIADNSINRVFEDSHHQIWVATENGGLNRLLPDHKGFAHYTTTNGLPSNVIFTMLEDARKNLWVATSKGLVCMNIVNNNLKSFTKANGLLSDQFNYNSAYKDAQGYMYFGCLKGLIKFNPSRFNASSYRPPVYLTGFQINNREVPIGMAQSPLKQSITYIDTLVLKYNQSSFNIDFAALSFTSPQMIEYAYKMDGLDKEWTYLRSNRKVYFTKLGPGNYIFKVKASNNSKLWGNAEKKLYIHVLPPIWASWYAYTFYAMLALLAGYYLLREYHKRTQEQNERRLRLLENRKEKETYEAKIAFFTHVAHEIRTPLTLIRGPLEKVMARAGNISGIEKNLKIMERNTDRLLALTNQLLDFRKTETHGFSLNFVKTDIIALVNDNLLRFSSALEARKLQVNVKLPGKTFYAYVDAEAMNKILSNLLDNAIKYAVAQIELELTTDTPNNQFTICIKNDGYLIPWDMRERIFETFFRMQEAEKQSGTGIGLPLSRYLAELHKGTLNLQHTETLLNIFALIIPIHQDIEFNL